MALDPSDESFQSLTLRFRGRTGLTQGQLALRAGVHVRSVQAWEGGVSYPSSASLQTLIATYLDAGAFSAGREAAEAEALWIRIERESTRQRPRFDAHWFAALLAKRAAPLAAPAGPAPGQACADASAAPPSTLPREPRVQDWGDSPDSRGFLGRTGELATARRWIVDESSCIVAVLGMGGIGKTRLAAYLARELAPDFERVYWRSMRNAPSFAEWSAGAIGFLSDQQRLPPDGDAARIGTLLELLRARRCLLVLDNLELLLQPGEQEGGYRPGYLAYGSLLQVLGQSDHRSCLLQTSREAPPELAQIGGEGNRVRVLELGGLQAADAQALLSDKLLVGDDRVWTDLVALYGGNGLALKVVGETIRQVFGGDIGAFLEQSSSGSVFGGIRRLLDSQIERLSLLERDVLQVLAVEREASRFELLVAELGRGIRGSSVIETLEALRRRSLVERTEPGASFTLPSVVLEYMTDRLVETAADEIELGQLDLLLSRPLIKAQSRDFVRQAQERLIAEPLLERVSARRGGRDAATRRLEALLGDLRSRPPEGHGFGPGNLVNLLRLLRGNLRSLDLSGLDIRQAFLQEAEAQDASLVRAHLSGAVLADAFSYPTCVALSADGVYLAAGTTTGEVCLWRVADRTLLATLRAHEGLVQDISLSDAGQRLASSSEDGTIRVWETTTGRVLATLQPPSGGVRSVALSGDGRVVGSGSHDGSVQLWDSTSGRLLGRAIGHASGVRDVALSRDGAVLASGHVDGSVLLWHAVGTDPAVTLDGHTAATWSVAVSADGRLIASGSVDATVRVWNLEANGEASQVALVGHTGAVWSVALNSDGRLLASGSFDGTIRLWRPLDGALLATLQGHTGGVRSVALTADGSLLASCSYDGTVRIWQTQNARRLATLRGHTSGVRGVAISRSGHLLASGSYDGTVRLWDTASGQQLRQLKGHTAGVWSVALSADGRLVASGSYDGTMRLWETQRGELVATIRGHTGGVWGVALGEQRRVAASGGEDGTVKLWDVEARQLLTTLQGHAGGVWNVALSGDGRYVAGGGEDGAVRVWDATTGLVIATLEGHLGGVWSVALSPDGRLVASGSFDGLVRVWEAQGGRLLWTLRGHTGAVWSVALSADGSLLASGGFDGSLQVWDTRTGTALRTLRADRRYERMDITDLSGITNAQREALLMLGAVDRAARATL